MRLENTLNVESLVKSAISAGFSLVPLENGRPIWGKAARIKNGKDEFLVGSHVGYGKEVAVDWDASGCVVLSGEDGSSFEVVEALGDPVYSDGIDFVYRAEHPGNRKWKIGNTRGKVLPRSKQWFPVDLSQLAEPGEPVDLTPILGKAPAPRKGQARRTKLATLQADMPALLDLMFPQGTHREEGDGYRVSLNGMTDNISVTLAESGDFLFKDFGEPPTFDPGDALSVMDQLSVAGKPEKRPQVADKPAAPKVSFKGDADEKVRMAQRAWRGAYDLFEDEDECAPAHAYLHTRGVGVPEGAMVRFDPECPFGHGHTAPCLIAGVTDDLDPGRRVVAIQRIDITTGEKRTLGTVKGAVNVSGRVLTEILGVAEGVCTALAAQEVLGAPFVATLGTGAMKALNVPECVTELVIAADNDAGGQGKKAALALAKRYAHLKVRVVMPSEAGKDFADEDFGEVVELEAGTTVEQVKAACAGLLQPAPADFDLLGGKDGLGEGKFAHEFMGRHGSGLRHDGRRSEAQGAWVEWDGRSWTRRGSAPMPEMASTIRDWCDDTADLKSFDRRSVRAGSLQLVAALTERREWDIDPMLLGLPNGLVLDLTTGDIRDQEKGDYITRSTNTMPADDVGDWPALVREICSGDESLYGVVQAIAVDCCTGHSGKDLMPIVHGEPGTGKSTVWNAIHRALGGYSSIVDSKHLLVTRNPPHSSWLAVLSEARMALTSEVPPGSTWNGPLVCTITGGDAVSANFMRKDHFSFVPAFRLVTLCNDLPAIPTAESGVNRRVRVLPFTNRVAGEGAGEDETIRDFYLGDGRGQVLRWLAESARAVNARDQEHRYPYSKVVADATAAYVNDRSDFDTWASEAIEVDCNGRFTLAEAQAAYAKWSEASGRQLLSEKAFYRELSRRIGMKQAVLRTDGGGRARGYTMHRLVEVKPQPRQRLAFR